MGKFIDTVLSWLGIEYKDEVKALGNGKQFTTPTFEQQGQILKEGIKENITDKINAHQETIRKNNQVETQIIANAIEPTVKEKYNEIMDALPSMDELKETSKDLSKGTGLNNEIQDTTNESAGDNSVVPIGGSFDLNTLKDLQKEQWAREDEIRKETQAREDSAYQRTVEDMKKAGINPNLMNVQPAASGGGITSATGIDYNGAQIEVEKYLTEIENMLDRELKADENQKDRLSDLLRGVITAAAIFFR